MPGILAACARACWHPSTCPFRRACACCEAASFVTTTSCLKMKSAFAMVVFLGDGCSAVNGFSEVLGPQGRH